MLPNAFTSVRLFATVLIDVIDPPTLLIFVEFASTSIMLCLNGLVFTAVMSLVIAATPDISLDIPANVDTLFVGLICPATVAI